MQNTLDSGPNLLLDWREPDDGSRVVRDVVGSLVFHLILFGFILMLAGLPVSRTEIPRGNLVARGYTRIYAPHIDLTQKEANKGKVVKQIKLENLLPKPEVTPRPAFHAPRANPLPPVLQPAALPPPPEPLRALVTEKPPQVAPPSVVAVAPPQIQPEEKPKLVFENPGQGGTSPMKGGMERRIPLPKNNIEEAIRSVARGGGSQGGLTVGDAETIPSLPDSLRRNPSKGRMQSNVELKSDPLGVDFKPYLIRLLSAVKRNWFSVWPESARLGLRGTVALRVVIDRSGQVPHIDVSMPSGAGALDRAAVASISASIPFSPLPAEFKSDKIVLVLHFQYN